MNEKESNERNEGDKISEAFAKFVKSCGESNLYQNFHFNEIVKSVVKATNLSAEVVSKRLYSIIITLLTSPRIELIDDSGEKMALYEENLQNIIANKGFARIRFYDPLQLTRISTNETINRLKTIYDYANETVQISCLNVINFLDRDRREYYEFFEYMAISDSNKNVQETARKIVLTYYLVKGIKLFKHLANNSSESDLPAVYSIIMQHFETIDNTVLPEYKTILQVMNKRYYDKYKKEITPRVLIV